MVQVIKAHLALLVFLSNRIFSSLVADLIYKDEARIFQQNGAVLDDSADSWILLRYVRNTTRLFKRMVVINE